MTEQEKKELILKLGALSEDLVMNYFKYHKGDNVKPSLDKYDSEKDFLLNGKTAELKAQHLVHRYNIFTLARNQVTKCKNVDHLFILELPDATNSWKLILWEAPEKEKRQFLFWRTINGVDKYSLPADKMTPIAIFNPNYEVLSLFKELDTGRHDGFKRNKKASAFIYELYRTTNKISVDKNLLKPASAAGAVEHPNPKAFQPDTTFTELPEDLQEDVEKLLEKSDSEWFKWVLTLAHKKFHSHAEVDRILEILRNQFDYPQTDAREPYLTTYRVEKVKSHNPAYDQGAVCECGHTYHRHFDSYENSNPIGCKYCDCWEFKPVDSSEFADKQSLFRAMQIFAKEHDFKTPNLNKPEEYVEVKNYYTAIENLKTKNI